MDNRTLGQKVTKRSLNENEMSAFLLICLKNTIFLSECAESVLRPPLRGVRPSPPGAGVLPPQGEAQPGQREAQRRYQRGGEDSHHSLKDRGHLLPKVPKKLNEMVFYLTEKVAR